MKEAVVILVGSGKGPDIPTFGKSKSSSLRISGLDGAPLVVRYKDLERVQTQVSSYCCDGTYPLLFDCSFVSVECVGPDDGLIVELLRN